MASNLYETLGLKKDATPEEVRKAYRRLALQTHPDRLPQNVSTADKKAAEEQFRLVNNAYEVLNDEENRKLYDKHGVWPPPAEQPAADFGRAGGSFAHNPFENDPFFRAHFGRSRHPFGFTDPFELFNSLFGDIHAAFDNDPFFAGTPFTRSPFDAPFFSRPTRMGDPFGGSPFGPMGDPFAGFPFGPTGDPFSSSMFRQPPFAGMLGGPSFPPMGNMPSGSARVYSSSSTEAMGSDGRWVSRSQMTRTINGRTEVVTTRRDAEGNEHVTYSTPEGERYTINGVEQPRGSVDAPGRRDGGPPRQPPPAITDRPHASTGNSIPPPQADALQPYGAPAAQGPSHSRAYNQPPLAQAPPVIPPPPHTHPERRSSHHGRREGGPAAPVDPRRSHTLPTSAHVPAERDRRHSSHVPGPAPPGPPAPTPAVGFAPSGRAHAAPPPQPPPASPIRRDYAYERRERDRDRDGRLRRQHDRRRSTPGGDTRERAPPAGEDQQQQPPQKQHGWRGWLNHVMHPSRQS